MGNLEECGVQNKSFFFEDYNFLNESGIKVKKADFQLVVPINLKLGLVENFTLVAHINLKLRFFEACNPYEF